MLNDQVQKILVINRPINETRDEQGFTVIGIADFLLRFIIINSRGNMNKQDIISILNDFPYSRSEYWVITGSAMVLYGIRQKTHDIDMGCTSKMADMLEAGGYPYTLTESGNRKFKIGENIEVFENWIKDTINIVDNIPVISIKGLVLMKQELGRDKDKKDIALIKEYLGTKIELVDNVLNDKVF